LAIFTLEILITAVLGAVVGWVGYQGWAAFKKSKAEQLPAHGDLKLRPLFNELDHKVLLKVPLVRFLSGGSADFQSLVPIKDIYCTFTVCSSQGRVVGCLDVAGAKEIKASRRDFKKKMFANFGLAYTVLAVDELPSPEALRAVFLNEAMPLIPFLDDYDTSHSSLAFESSTVQAMLDPVASVRHNLHAKLDTNRKMRPSGLPA
jgi:hypothetical protein